MRFTIQLMLAICLATVLDVSRAEDLSGTWEGPWYRGMTSGTMVLAISAAGDGSVQFVNLDNFGEASVALSDVRIEGKRFDFSASGEGASVFVASTQLIKSGTVLKGKGRYDGFPIKFNLKRRQ